MSIELETDEEELSVFELITEDPCSQFYDETAEEYQQQIQSPKSKSNTTQEASQTLPSLSSFE